MRDARAAKWMLLAAALTLCCACGVNQTPSVSEEPAAPALYFGGTPLHWQTPENDCRIIGMLSDEDGFAVLYEEERKRSGDPEAAPDIELMAQLFDAGGLHQLTTYTGVWREAHNPPKDLALSLAPEELHLTLYQRYDYSVDRATGDVRQWRYEPLLRENGATLSYSSERSDQTGTVGMRYRLEVDHGHLYELAVPGFDHNFNMALDFLAQPEYIDREGITYVATAEIDADAKTAVLSNTKLTYTLDFGNGSYTRARHYTDGMLEDVLATSPDQNNTLYTADGGGAGDAFWQDVVLRGPDGGIAFLAAESGLYGAEFFDNGTVLLSNLSSLEAFDITAAQPEGRPLLDLGTIVDASGRTQPARLVVGMAVDREHRLLLAALRDYSDDWDALLPVTLAVFDASLKPIAEIATDARIRPYGNNWPMRCDIALGGDGTATLSWYRMQGAPVQVRYLP